VAQQQYVAQQQPPPQQYAPPPPQQQYAPPPTISTTGEPSADPQVVMDELKQLGELKAAGVLTDEEFAVKKAELLKQI